MSQQAMSNDPDACEGSQLPCQCSVMSNVDSILQRERSERNIGSKRISKVQDLPRGLETLQNMFEPIRNRDPSPSIQESQQISLDNSRSVESIDQSSLASSPRPTDVQKNIYARYGHTLSCSPRSVDLSRNLAVEAARRVQETSNFQDNQHRQLSSPGSLLDSNSDLNEMSLNDMENDVDDGEDLSTSPTKEKIKMKVLSSYQHHPEPSVHSHLLSEAHSHIYKHENLCKHDTYCGSNLNSADVIMGFPHPRHHSHHHHKISSLSHHPNHSSGTTSNLSTYVYGTPGSSVTTPSPSPMNRGSSQNIYHHPGTPTNNSNLTTMDHRNSPAAHHRMGLSGNGSRGSHQHGNASFVDPSGHYHGTASVMSGTSSNSSLINHGSSPTVHRHVVNANSSLSTTPLISHHHRSSSGSLTGNSTTNHHHVSSGISCESSSSNANTRTHSRLDHIHDHHHHLQAVHALHSTLPDTRPRERTPSSLDRHSKHHSHVRTHTRSHSQNEAKHAALMGVNNIQVSTPSKNKCQCHLIQQGGGSKRGPEGESDRGGEVTLRTHQPPALPPRPPPRPARRFETVTSDPCQTGEGGCCKKYVVLCCLCGGFSATVGSLFLTIHVLISANTASLALFETVPSYIPGTMLILMGLFTMLLARRKYRYGLLMKVCGSVAVVCALVCVLVTVTTTVVHMSRLQGLRECVYTARAKSCTCYGATTQNRGDHGVLFEATPHCDVVQGTLYSCLRALFGTSVAGILVCIFSCMLLYQLLSHEKKKMYWEQLELRCRSLYGQGGAVRTVTGSCGCCSDCGGTNPWWAQTPGNLYTPNPDMAPSRWRLPWSRSRGPAPSPDSNYGFHAQAMRAEANAENNAGPYSVLNSQSGGPYSVLNTQNGQYTSSTASYSVLEAPVPLWGPPPPYSDPNSPARRPQVPEARPRISKRMENYESNEDYRPRVTKRPSDNYENAEEISNSTDPEGGNEGTIKSRRLRKPLKGVENGAFQQEPNPAPKQSESELYFGDVSSSCCGPESSFYDLAVDKEAAEHPEGVDYLATRLGKRQLSKRSRHPLPLPPDGGVVPSNSYSNTDESRNARGPYLAPDAQYEVIQQGRYAYYSSKADEEHKEGPTTTSAYFREEDTERERERERNREREYRDYRSNQEEETPQCCLSDSTTLDSGWQSGEQQHSDDNARPLNV